MPYISPHRREMLDKVWNPDFDDYIQSAGELNYLLTRLAHLYVFRNGTPGYKDFNDVLGAFDGASKEFYRRLVVPYEEEKIKENGDI